MLKEFLYGAGNTIFLIGISWIVGLPIGILLSFIGLLNSNSQKVFRFFTIILSILPLLVILFWLHYPLQYMLNVVWSPTTTSIFLLTFYIALMSGDILAEEMIKIRKSLFETALVLGIPNKLFISKVVFPASFQGSLPRLLSLAIGSVHITMFTSLIGVEELFRVSQRLNAQFLKPIEIFTLMAFVYALICLPLYILARIIKRNFKDNNA